MNAAATREKILNTSFRLFLKKGFTDVSINDIIKKAGISKGGFFHHFRNKDHLLREIIQDYIFSYIEILAERIIGSQGTVHRRFIAYFSLIQNLDREIQALVGDKTIRYRSLYLLMMEALKKFSYFEKQYTEIVSRIYGLIRQQVISGQQSGEIARDIDVDTVSYKLLVIYEGVLHVWIINPDMKLPRMNRKLFDALWDEIKA